MPTDAGDIETRIEFEELLCRRGFSRSRAKAITAKGFRGADSSEVADIVRLLSDRREHLQIEQKSNGVLRTTALKTWSAWQTLGQINPTGPSRFTIEAKAWGLPPLTAPFFLQVKFRDRNRRVQIKRWVSHGGAAGNGPYEVPAGLQTIQVKTQADNATQRIVVWLRP